jgi:3-oxoacyl-[acyl-carrier-protein] synthase-3
MEDVSLTGWGSYLPRLSHTNESLPPLDTPVDAKDLEKIGVYRRGWARDGEGIAEMAAEAAKRALERAGTRAADLDLVILANWTQRRYIPEFAPRLQQLIGAERAFAHEVCCACAGFLYGVGTAHSHLQNPRYSRALVVAAETTSIRGRPGSKATLVFGDAAGAVVIERGARPDAGRLIDYELATYGQHHHIMEVDANGWVKTHIEQRELGALAATTTAEVLGRLLERNHLTFGDIAWLVPHSGTAGVQAALARTLKFPIERTLTNFAEVGNVSSASIPVAIDHYLAAGKIRRGDLVASTAVGTGWYAAAAVYRV